MWTKIVDSISAGMAFFPPNPPSYSVDRHPDDGSLYVLPQQPRLKKVPQALVLKIAIPKTDDTITAALIPAPAGFSKGNASSSGSSSDRSLSTPFTILHSHGNAVDLGQMLPLYEQLAKLLRVNVCAYDYRGYGTSKGQPAASSTFSDISAVYSTLLSTFNLKPSDIIVYGQSVGSGPTSWLAARQSDLAGVVLHSPFLSGVRVLKPDLKRWPSWADIFPNFKYVPRIESKILVLHGTKDEVIDIQHGRELWKLAKTPSTAGAMWAEEYGHQDLEASPEYIPRLRKFLIECFGEEYSKLLRTGRV